MGLSKIAEEVGAITHHQQDSGVHTIDETDRPLVDRLASVDTDLPCEPSAAATVVEAYAAGASVGGAAREAGLAPITAAKTLHRCGIPGIQPISPGKRDVLRDWLAGRLSRHESEMLLDVSDRAFALGVYVETHDPLESIVPAVERVLTREAEGGPPTATLGQGSP